MLKSPVVTGRLAPYRFYLELKAGGIGREPSGTAHHPHRGIRQQTNTGRLAPYRFYLELKAGGIGCWGDRWGLVVA
jgi:hypothetical protein